MRRLRAAKRVQTQHCPSFNVGCKKRMADALYSLGILRSMTLQYCKQRCFAMSHEESASIGEFIDAVWLEDGLAANTLAAYRLDLIGFEEWLRSERGLALDTASGGDIEAWFAAKHSQTKPSTANRRSKSWRTAAVVPVSRLCRPCQSWIHTDAEPAAWVPRGTGARTRRAHSPRELFRFEVMFL